MIIGDALEAPRERTTLLRLTAGELQEKYNRRTYHFRESGSGLVIAEGEEEVGYLNNGCTMINAVPGRLYGYEPGRGYLCIWGTDVIFPYLTAPLQLLRYFDAKGMEEHYCITDKKIVCINDTTWNEMSSDKGGTCAALFHDRLFTAKGFRVNYSRALNGNDWTPKHYGPGYIELFSDEMGEILGMLPYKDKLYLMRSHGITYLRALGDELNFKAVHMPMKCGKLIAHSAAACGEYIGYFTDGGFYLFNGAVSTLAPNARHDEIDFKAPVKAFAYSGKYYALVSKKAGGTTVYCYDPEWREGHFIENGAIDLAVGDEVYFVRSNTVYRLIPKGISKYSIPYFTAENIGLSLNETKMLRSLLIEGEGEFRVRITSNRGSRTVKGEAGKILKLSSPLRGNGFSLKIRFESDYAERVIFQAVQLRITEESNEN